MLDRACAASSALGVSNSLDDEMRLCDCRRRDLYLAKSASNSTVQMDKFCNLAGFSQYERPTRSEALGPTGNPWPYTFVPHRKDRHPSRRYRLRQRQLP